MGRGVEDMKAKAVEVSYREESKKGRLVRTGGRKGREVGTAVRNVEDTLYV